MSAGRLVQVLVAAFTMLAIVVLLHVYLGSRLIGGLGLTGPAAAVAWVALGLLFASVPLGFAGTRGGPKWLAVPLWWVCYFWMGAFGLLLVGVLTGDAIRWLWSAWASPSPEAMRQFMRVEAAVILGFVGPAVAWGYRVAHAPARIEQVTVKVDGLGPGMAGLKVVQITDLHIGQTLRAKFLQRVVDQVNALQPDVVAITGDLIDGTVARVGKDVMPLQNLRPKLGSFYVTGNHEYYAGAAAGATAWENHVASLGVSVLHNQHQVLSRNGDSLVVAGVTDYNGGQFSEAHESRPDLAVAGAPAGVPRILLAHQPRSAPAAAPLGFALQLSGHTHGGQVFPFMFFVPLQQPVVRGLRRLAGLLVYTSRGTGYWGPPMRIGPSPEITEVTLVPA